MEVNEALRRIIAGHWVVLTLALILPFAVVGAAGATRSASYVSSARIQASSTPPGSETEADSVLNRVKGIATSSSVVSEALSKVQGPTRSPADVAADEVGVSRLGTSAVFDLSVTDSDPEVALALTRELTTRVVDFLNTSGSQHADVLITNLQSQRRTAISQRQAAAAKLAVTIETLKVAALTAQIGTLNQEIDDLSLSLRQLQLSSVTATTAAVISGASQAQLVATHLPTDLALALVAGLVAGLMISALLEVVRPRVADAHAFARDLGTPMLGAFLMPGHSSSAGQAHDDVVPQDVLVALRGAAMRAGIRTLVVSGSVEPDRMQSLLSGLEGQLNPAKPFVGHATRDVSPVDADRSTPAVKTNGDGSVRTLISNPMHKSTAPPGPRGRSRSQLHVTQLASLESQPATGHVGLVVVVENLAPFSALRGVRDLAFATGWPLIGVLAYPRTGRRG